MTSSSHTTVSRALATAERYATAPAADASTRLFRENGLSGHRPEVTALRFSAWMGGGSVALIALTTGVVALLTQNDSRATLTAALLAMCIGSPILGILLLMITDLRSPYRRVRIRNFVPFSLQLDISRTTDNDLRVLLVQRTLATGARGRVFLNPQTLLDVTFDPRDEDTVEILTDLRARVEEFNDVRAGADSESARKAALAEAQVYANH